MFRPPCPRATLGSAFAAAVLLGFGCGGDEEGETETAPGPDLARYCELSAEADRAGDAAFAGLESDPEATREDYEAAEREFVEDNQALLDELGEVAPVEISQDLEIMIAGIRARAGLGPSVDEADAVPAEKRVQTFEKQNC